MTEWSISLPYRDRADAVASIADAAGALPDREDREVARGLALELVLEPDVHSVGDAFDAIEHADPPARRGLLDRARERAGLPTVDQAEQRVTYELANAPRSLGPLRDGSGRIEARCAFPTCRRIEAGPFPGAAAWVNVRRWFCREHAHLAAPGDSEPYRSRLAYGPRGSIIDLDEREAEAERQRVTAESRRRQREAREAERREDAERLAELEAAHTARLERERIWP